ncbi:MAG: hypothetical protein IPK13_24895 [Deltaproteobacteria bacterium]|nr:hypothetical protein [Deltaproteobacteria bacterium]
MGDLHPAVIHFPIVLVVLWPIVDLIGFWAKSAALSRLAVGLLAAAVVVSLVATVTGQAAMDAALLRGTARPLLRTHTALADAVPWVLLVLLAVRGWGPAKFGRVGRVTALILGFGCWPGIWVVGRTGGALVYSHGVGVNVGTDGGGHGGAHHGANIDGANIDGAPALKTPSDDG